MEEDFCTTCVKYLLCVANFGFFVVGSCVLSVGLWLVVDKTSFIQVTRLDTIGRIKNFGEPDFLDHAAYILVAIGAFIFIISFLGYCGTLQENRVLLTAYGLLLLIIFALQITVVILTVSYRTHADEQTRQFLKNSLSTSYTVGSNKNTVTLSWDIVMANMQCCGVNNYSDFRDASLFVESAREEGLGRMVPESCCILQGDRALFQPADEDCIAAPTTANSYLYKGCYNKFRYFINQHLHLLVGAMVGLGAAQMLAIGFAFCISKAVRGDPADLYK